MTTGRSLVKSAGMVTILLFISRLLGFARESSIAYRFGSSLETDAYFMAVSIATVLFVAINDAVKTVFIPVYGDLHNKEEGNAFAYTVYIILAAILVVVCGLLLAFAPLVVPVLARGFSGRKLELTVNMTRIMLPGLLFMGLSGLSSAVLNIKKNFFLPAIVAYPHNLIIVAAALFAGVRFGITGLAWATLAGYAFQFLIQVPAAAGYGVFRRRRQLLNHSGLKKMAWLLPPVIVGGITVELKTLIDKSFGSLLAEGSVSALNYANRVYMLPNNIIVLALLTVIYPALVEQFNKDSPNAFKKTLRQGIGLIITLVFPMMVGMIVLREPIVRLVFERGKFLPADTLNVAYALGFYALGLLPMGIMLLFNRAFYADKDTLTPMVFTFFTVILNIILNWLLMKPLAHGGIALGTAISLYVGAAGMGYLLRRRIGPFGGYRLVDTLWKTGIASLLMGAAVRPALPYLAAEGFLRQALSLGLVIAGGAGLYFCLAYFLRVEELRLGLALLKSRLKAWS
ncbi:MAG TPA: murein biosynthesis integral membrane protein MurJ [Firmicutes bacterium]|nr:murein biosynthesis integral membrane protein MurJ [Bacillota bacterium]